ncbi:MAG: VTC domain-containing protein [Planctomycetota bacterium]
MADDKMQLQRWELKYVIPEGTALGIREFVRPYLDLDEYGVGRPNLSYTIHNLYLDSDDLGIYWGTINGNKNRYKLRLRFYEDNLAAPIFFEIKRRMNEAILKQRGGVKRPHVESVLAGQLPGPDEMVSGEGRQVVAVQNFVRLMMEDRAGPTAHVRYEREAWISPFDNSVRVTMDRNVMIAPEFAMRFSAAMDEPTSVFGDRVILELKFSGRFPDWFKELVRVFGLRQGSASKYADGIANKGERYFCRPGGGASASMGSLGAEDRRRDRRDRLAALLGGA